MCLITKTTTKSVQTGGVFFLPLSDYKRKIVALRDIFVCQCIIISMSLSPVLPKNVCFWIGQCFQ
jgi:hypothetical protein